MSKCVMLSVYPDSSEKIMRSIKTLEITKTKPNIQTPFKCYIFEKTIPIDEDYDSNKNYGSGKVIAEFICEKISAFQVFGNGSVQNWNWLRLKDSGYTYEELANHIGSNKTGYAWQISNLNVYSRPKNLNGFQGIRKTKFGHKNIFLSNPPKTWYYVESID